MHEANNVVPAHAAAVPAQSKAWPLLLNNTLLYELLLKTNNFFFLFFFWRQVRPGRLTGWLPGLAACCHARHAHAGTAACKQYTYRCCSAPWLVRGPRGKEPRPR